MLAVPVRSGTPSRTLGWAWLATCVSFAVAATALVYLAAWIPSFWGDEAATVRGSSLPLPELLDFLGSMDAVHGVYYVVTHGWTSLFGSSEAALRLLSSIATGLTAGLLLQLGRLLADKNAGVIAGLVFVALPRTTFSAIEARSYALSGLFAVLATVAFVYLLRRATVGRYIAYIGICVIGVWLYIYLVLVVLAHAVSFAILRREGRAKFLAAAGAIALVATPIVLVSASQRQQVEWLGEQDVLNPWAVLVEPWAESSWAVGILIWIVLIAGAVRWRTVWARYPTALVVCAPWVVVPTLALVAGSVVLTPLYRARYLTFCAPAMALIIAVILASLLRTRFQTLAVVLLVVLAVPTAVAQRQPNAKNGGSDLREVAEVIDQRSTPGDGLYFEASTNPILSTRWALYAYPDAFRGLDDVALDIPFPESGTIEDRTQEITDLDPARLDGLERIWVVGASGRCDQLPGVRTLDDEWDARTFEQYRTHRSVVCEVVLD